MALSAVNGMMRLECGVPGPTGDDGERTAEPVQTPVLILPGFVPMFGTMDNLVARRIDCGVLNDQRGQVGNAAAADGETVRGS